MYKTSEQNRIRSILKLLFARYPQSKTALQFSDPLELLIATILSAQCTDARVNEVTRVFFKKYKSAEDYSKLSQSILEKEIHSTGFFRNKAKNIICAAKKIVLEHDGKVPRTIDELVTLPGVGRKTANCVLGGAFGINSGVVVDTHVKRISKRLAFTQHSDPEKVEVDLMKIIPQKKWYQFSNMLISHGRQVCKARKPDCHNCVVNHLCTSAVLGNLGKIRKESR